MLELVTLLYIFTMWFVYILSIWMQLKIDLKSLRNSWILNCSTRSNQDFSKNLFIILNKKCPFWVLFFQVLFWKTSYWQTQWMQLKKDIEKFKNSWILCSTGSNQKISDFIYKKSPQQDFIKKTLHHTE